MHADLLHLYLPLCNMSASVRVYATPYLRLPDPLCPIPPLPPPSPGRSLDWLWSSPSAWAGIPSDGVLGQRLFVPGPVPAVHGATFTLRVTGSYVGGKPARSPQACPSTCSFHSLQSFPCTDSPITH